MLQSLFKCLFRRWSRFSGPFHFKATRLSAVSSDSSYSVSCFFLMACATFEKFTYLLVVINVYTSLTGGQEGTDVSSWIDLAQECSAARVFA